MSCCQLEQDIRSTFGVTLGANHASTLETVGQLHDLVRAEFAEHLQNDPETVSRLMALEGARRALRRVLEDTPDEIDFRAHLENLLPKNERVHSWAALNRELDGVLPKLVISQATSSFASCGCVTLVVATTMLAPIGWWFVNFYIRVSFETAVVFWLVNCLLYWIVIQALLKPFAVQVPPELQRVADLASLWSGVARSQEPTLPTGERELWHLLRKIISDVSGHDPKRITRETRFADLGIE